MSLLTAIALLFPFLADLAIMPARSAVYGGLAGSGGAVVSYLVLRGVLLVRLRAGLAGVERANRRLRILERIIPELVIETDTDGVIGFANEAARGFGLGPGRGGASSWRLAEFVSPADQSDFAGMFHTALAGGMPPVRRLHLHLGGELLPVRAIFVPLVEGAGEGVAGVRAVFVDIRDEVRASRALDQQRQAETTLTEILRALIHAGEEEWVGTLDRAMTSLRGLLRVDRCSLLRLAAGDEDVVWEFQWAAEDVAAVAPEDHVTRSSTQPWLAARMRKGRPVLVGDVRELPAEAAAESALWRRLDVASLAAFPLFAAGRVVGVMTFTAVGETADWSPEDVRLLETFSGMIVSTWQQLETRRAERATSRRLEDIIDFLPDPTFVVDSTGRILAWNKGMAGLTGRNGDEMIGRGDRAYALPFRGERVPMLVDYFMDAPRPDFGAQYEYFEKMNDTVYAESFIPFANEGQGCWLWCTASPLKDSEGRIVGAIESLRDVTYRRAAERKQREDEARYRSLVETMNDGMGMIDADGRITFVNDRLCEMTGFAREDLVDRHLGQFLPGAEGAVTAEWEGWRRDPGDAIEIRFPCRDGRTFPARVSPSAIHRDDGEFDGGFAVITDMTSIRRAERRYRMLNENLEKRVIESTRELVAANDALRVSEERYRRIIETLREGYVFYSLDTEGRFTYASPSHREVFGHGALADFEEAVRGWYREEGNAEARAAAARTFEGAKQPPYELRVRDRDGESLVIEILEAPVFDAAGKLESVEGIMRDVTEDRRNLDLVRETQSRLMESEKLAALGGLVAGVSHEINTPIGIGVTASSHLEELHARCEGAYRDGSLTQARFEEFLADSRESSGLVRSNLLRAADLLQNFKMVAVDQTAQEVRDVRLAEYLAEVIRSFSPRLRNTGFRIRCECAEDLVLRCDPGAVYQIVSNLVFNSLKHGFDGMLVGEITIGVHDAGSEVVLDYRDNGNGMRPEQVARIYEPFYTTRRGQGGTGLGMHIVYNNVTRTLGGRIVCTSRPGAGARFEIRVPRPKEIAHA